MIWCPKCRSYYTHRWHELRACPRCGFGRMSE